jgi:hypothetical protein
MRVTASAVTMLALAFAASSPAVARVIVAGPGPQLLEGTPGGDSIYGGHGADTLLGRAGPDRLSGGPGPDSIHGGPGADRLFGRDRNSDSLHCGPGRDVALADRRDRVFADCEVVRLPPAGATATPEMPTPAPSPRAAVVPPPAPPPPAGEEPGEEQPEEEEEEEEDEVPPDEQQPLSLFPAGHGWTGNGKGKFEDSGPPFVLTGDRSFKIETDGVGDESVATSPQLEPVDLTDSHVRLESLISFSAHLGEVRLRLSSGDIETDYAEATFWKEGLDPIGLNSNFEPQTVPTGAFEVVGDVDWSEIDRAQLILTDNDAGPVSLYVAGIYAVRTIKHPLVSFAFDDGHESTFDLGRTALSRYHYPASVYVISNAVGDPGYMTLAQLETLRDRNRWEVGGHAASIASHNLPLGLDSLEPEQLETEMDSLRDWLDAHDFPRRTFAYPKGAAGELVRQYAARDYCAGRTTAEGPETLPPRNQFTLRGWSINGLETDAAEIEEAIDRAAAENAWLILTFHDLVPGQPEEATDFNYKEFTEVVKYVRSLHGNGAPKVRTIADAIGC